MQMRASAVATDSLGINDDALRELLMRDVEAFRFFFEEAKRRGVRLSMGTVNSRTMANQNSIQPSDKDQSFSSTRAVVRTDSLSDLHSSSDDSVGEQILRKLRWNAHDPGTARNLSTLLDRIKECEIDEPDSYLSLRDAAQKSGVAERTLRRYIADGQLQTEKVKGPRGWEHRVYVPALFAVLQLKAGAFERAHSNPLEEMGREVATLCRAIVEQQSLAESRTNKLVDEMRNQSRVMDELRNEHRETRSQMMQLQEQMIQALLPQPKKSFWQRIFSRE